MHIAAAWQRIGPIRLRIKREIIIAIINFNKGNQNVIIKLHFRAYIKTYSHYNKSAKVLKIFFFSLPKIFLFISMISC